MDNQPSPIIRMEVDRRSSSPKRKKIRQKYAPKACVSCRRSKLKCSGENPCQRCIDNGKRCFFSEDQTAAEALQNLSRPTASHQAQPSNPSANGNGTSRRSVLPRDSDTERRASDASGRGMSMEARMARVEAMMEALMRDRGLTMTPMGSIERDDSGSDGFRGDPAFSMPPLDPINPALVFLGQQSVFPPEPSNSTPAPMQPSGPPFDNTEQPHLVQLGNRTLPFPGPEEYQQYLLSFFTDIHLSHPCIDEADFRSHSEHMLASTIISPSESHFLALNYTIFACCDVLLSVAPTDGSKPRGWRWFELADHVLDKKALLSGTGGLVLIQCVFYQALYYTFADMPGLAYNTIGLASKFVFQHSLHQQSTWTNITTAQAYERLCVFWNVFIVDRLISLSCIRPHSIQDAHCQLELPVELFNRSMLPEQVNPEHDPRPYINQYLQYMILWARYVGNTINEPVNSAVQEDIDSQITYFLEHELPQLRVPYGSPSTATEPPHKALLEQKKVDFVLWGCRPAITSLQYEDSHAAHFRHLALCTVTRLSAFAQDVRRPCSFRFQMVSSLAGALLVLCSLLVRDPPHNRHDIVEGFQNALAMLKDLAYSQPYAKRVLADLDAIIRVVEDAIAGKDIVEDVATLFPYGAHVTLNPRTMDAGKTHAEVETDGGKSSQSGCGVLWL